MLSRTFVVALLAAALAAGFARGAPAQYKEPLFLAHSVAAGDLPPVEKRLPARPRSQTWRRGDSARENMEALSGC